MPANNNYKVFANGAQRVGYKRFHTGRYAVNPVPRDGRPATIQDGFTFQGDKNQRQVVHARTPSCPRRRRPAGSTCAPSRT